MKHVADEQIKVFIDACHQAAAYGLLRYSSGNMSWRVNDELVLMSASRSWLAELTGGDVTVCKIDDGRCINGKTPSVEHVFHIGILRQRSDVNVVLHFQSPYATAIACGEPDKYNFFVIPEIPFYIGRPAIVEYLPPGSPELAEAVVAAMKEHDTAILRNHGLVTVGRDFKDVIQKAGFFELACQILLCQDKPIYLSQAAVDALTCCARSPSRQLYS